MDKPKNLVRFNVQNAKYALPGADGKTFGTPVSFGTSRKVALESDSSQKVIYGDGRKLCTIMNDKGKTGTLTLNNICDAYEIAMGRKLRTANGLADIKQTQSIVHALYFEIQNVGDDGSYPIAKTWLYGVTSTRPSESYEQTEDDIKESSFDIPLDIRGIAATTAAGEEYKDAKGNVVYVWSQTAEPGDEGYDTFGDAVVLPVVPASAPAQY